MALSNELISQFVKTTKDTDSRKKDVTVYGTVVDKDHVQLDGSTISTPIKSTVELKPNDRVVVMIKDHMATVTGNLTSPAVQYSTVEGTIIDIETLLSDTVQTEELEAQIARIDTLVAANADVDLLIADYAEMKTLTTDHFTAIDADIVTLKAEKITAKDIEGKYANIDFSNITNATIEAFYSKSGLIKDAKIGDVTISGELVGVTINGDLIKANTLVADRLILLGQNGLYYKLNADGMATEAEQTEYNSLNGSVITTNSITASKINVEDLVAFDATIGGFNIASDSLYSGVKSTIDNTTRGIYLDNTGQIAFGDASNYIKYYKDGETYKLAISAGNIVFSGQDLGTRMSTIEQTASDVSVRLATFGGRNYVKGTAFGHVSQYSKFISSGTLTRTVDGLKFECGNTSSPNGFVFPLAYDGCLENSVKYTLSFKYRTNATSTGTMFVLQRTSPNVNLNANISLIASDTEWQTFKYTFSKSDINARSCYALLFPYITGEGKWIEIKDKTLKFERGEESTPWTPALEDSSDAGKTATDYLNLSSAGLVVGQNPTNPTAGNTLISSDGVTIRKGTTILAAFKAASRTASGISSATLTSSNVSNGGDTDTRVSGTIGKNESRATIYITTNGNPVYFQKGLETDKVLINNSSGIIANCNLVLDGSIVDNTGEGIFTPRNSYGNLVLGYGRYQDGGGTHIYGDRVKAKTKTGFFASVDGHAAIETNNDSGNATFGYHQYSSFGGETNIYGTITRLVAKEDITLDPEGNHIRFNGSFVPYNGNKYNIGTSSFTLHDVYICSNNDGTLHGLKFSNTSSTHNAVGVNADGYQIFGNSSFCTNIITKSTTTSSTGYSFKITCGENPALTVDDNDARLLLFGGTDSTSRYLGSLAVYKRTYSNAANIYITNNGMMGRSTSSSERYKTDIIDLELDAVKSLYDLPVRQFKYKSDCVAPDDERYGLDMPGFIAEEVAEYLPIACDHIKDQNGEVVPEMWNSKIIIPAMLKLIQDLNNRVKELEESKGEIQNG